LKKYSASVYGSKLPWLEGGAVVADDFHDGSVVLTIYVGVEMTQS
jgi:hypothetical protein